MCRAARTHVLGSEEAAVVVVVPSVVAVVAVVAVPSVEAVAVLVDVVLDHLARLVAVAEHLVEERAAHQARDAGAHDGAGAVTVTLRRAAGLRGSPLRGHPRGVYPPRPVGPSAG